MTVSSGHDCEYLLHVVCGHVTKDKCNIYVCVHVYVLCECICMQNMGVCLPLPSKQRFYIGKLPATRGVWVIMGYRLIMKGGDGQLNGCKTLIGIHDYNKVQVSKEC